jgi:transcriptional regulator with XRE-family HTH domain
LANGSIPIGKERLTNGGSAMKETFDQILLSFRNRAGLTQKQLANDSHVSESLISRLERDMASTTIRFSTIELLADALGLS